MITRGLYCPPPFFSHNAFILQSAMSAVEDISQLTPPPPQSLTVEQVQRQIVILEAALQAERGALALSRSCPQAGPIIQLPLPHRPGTISGCVQRTTSTSGVPDVVEGFDESQRHGGVTKATGGGVSPGSPLPGPQMLSAAQVFLLRSMAEITSNLKSAADALNGAVARQRYSSSPYEKKMKRLDDVLSDWGYVPFADYDEETLRGLQTHLPFHGGKSLKLVRGELCVDEDDVAVGIEVQHMGHWSQGCQFELSRMMVHPNKRISSPDVLQDRIMFFQVIDALKFSDDALKLKTINEVLRRMAVLKAELWMPNLERNHLLFTEALLLGHTSRDSQRATLSSTLVRVGPELVTLTKATTARRMTTTRAIATRRTAA